jgi:class 3 adenylate cyclase/DNA-directed RNA polymerase subunit N (RpoN/RPB10)
MIDNKGQNSVNAKNIENTQNAEKKNAEKTSGLLDELKSSKYCCEKAFAAIKNIIETGGDFDCYKINAFRIAETAGVGRSEMLRAFLFATKIGIFDLNWDIHCPSCRGIPEYHKHLMGLKNTAHCDLCAIDWDLDIEEQLEVTFTVTSNYPYMNGFLVTPVAPRNNWVSAAFVTSQQDFRDLFSGEFLSPGLSFAVKNMTLMFTDITGSTALYEAIGDAGAYSAVNDHFGVMIQIIKKYEGGIVKTIGDAVMAFFPVNAAAVRATCEIQRMFSSGAVRDGGIKVKIGLHRGPAIAVTSNRNLDFFGRSVNIAARVQSKSIENEVLLTDPVKSDPGVERYFIENKLKPERREVTLKGIKEPIEVYALKF